MAGAMADLACSQCGRAAPAEDEGAEELKHGDLLLAGESQQRHRDDAPLVGAGVDIYASSGVTNGRGSFGYVVYVRVDQFEKAASALGV